MNHEDPAEALRRAVPVSPPESAFDLDRIVADGYRMRRRNRIMLGGATAAGAVAAVGAVALIIASTPGGPDAAPDVADTEARLESVQPPEQPPENTGEAWAGYPYDADWESALDPVFGAPTSGSEAAQVERDAGEHLGPLLLEAGVPVDSGDGRASIGLAPRQRPGNYGQTWLRSYFAGYDAAVGGVMGHLRPVYSLEVLWPGGWTAEPGPITEQLFPQHLISDGPYYTDQDPVFAAEDLGDGRTLYTADHGCAFDVAVAYPNGTGLRIMWDTGCDGEWDHPVELAELTAAALAMPEYEFDTGALAPVGELLEVPTGWVHDPADAWARSAEAGRDARETYDGARTALQDMAAGAVLGEGGPGTLGTGGRGVVVHRSYSGSGTLPWEVDGDAVDMPFELRYYLPGGWVPGYSEEGDYGPHLQVCEPGHECRLLSDDDGTRWVFEVAGDESLSGEGTRTGREWQVVRYDPAGWAVGMWVQWGGDVPFDADVLAEVLRAMPPPDYDRSEPTVPEG